MRLLLAYFGSYHAFTTNPLDESWSLHIDEGSFTAWFVTAAERGLSAFYDSTWSDYPPFNIYIFWVFGKLAQAIGPDSLPFILKLPQTLFDLATAFLIFGFLRPRVSLKVALGLTALYAFNPATIFDLAVWGQMDSVYTFFMVASLISVLRSRYELSGGLLALAILTKPQSVVLLPVLAYVMLRNGGWQRAVSSSAVFGAVVFLVILPFDWDSPVAFLIDRYSGYNLYQFNSINAYNFWALLSFWKSDTVPHMGLTYQVWGILAFLALAATIMWQLHRKYEPKAAIFAVFLLMFGFFMLMTRMHERYLFPAFALLVLGWPSGSSWRLKLLIFAGLTATSLANLAYVLSVLNADRFIPDGHWSIYVLVPANALLFALSLWYFYRMQRQEPSAAGAVAVPGMPEDIEERPPPRWKDRGQWPAYTVALLAIVYFSLSVWNLGDIRSPTSDFAPLQGQRIINLDVGSETRVDKVFVLLQDRGSADIDVYWGSPDNWTLQGSIKESDRPHQWKEVNLGQDTRYVRLDFKTSSAHIGEVALWGNDRRIDIDRVTNADGLDVGAQLVDEQEVVDSIPTSHMSRTYFDEIYFVQAAEDHLRLEDPSERTHPPMSKLIIGAGIKTFGHNPFGWRIMGVIFATLMIPLIYMFASRMFGSPRAGLIAAFLLTFDFMHFVQARLATGETFILFFVMAMFYFFYRYWEEPSRGAKFLFISLVFFGLGFATKWVVMWGFAGMMLLLILRKLRRPENETAGRLSPAILLRIWKPVHRNEVIALLAGGAVAVAIYLLSYIPYFLAGHGLGDFWDLQWFAYEFHAGLEQGHPYSSEWWSWPLMLTPLYMYLGSFGDTTAYIASMGNPALWWVGIPAMIALLWVVARHRNKTAIFILIAFLAQWLIFVSIGRVLFIYHFYPNVLFMILAVVFWAEWLWKRYRWGWRPVAGYLALNVASFGFLFPVISGYPMSQGYWDSLRWVVDWVTRGWL